MATQPDDFADAFAQFAEPEKAAGAAPAEPPAATEGDGDGGGDAGKPAAGSQPAAVDDVGGDDGGAAAPADTPPVDDPPAGEVVPPADDPPAPAAEPPAGESGGAVTPPAADADAILAGLKKLVGDAKPAEGAPAGEPAAAEAPIYSKEEQDFLQEYEKDWDAVSRGEGLKRRAEYRELASFIFQEVNKFMTPLKETTEVLAERTFRHDVMTAVPDYSDQLRNEVVDWVKTQPAYLQVAYNHVITEGTVDEVKDLISRYRQVGGKVATKQPAPSPARGNELSDEAKKAAAALAPVDSKRSGVQQPSDLSNFDDAWKQAATELG